MELDTRRMLTEGDVSVDIAASPAAVYAVISDLPRTPTWSEECVRVDWTSATPGIAGATWKGWSRVGRARWTREGVVEAAVPGRLFTFRTVATATKRDSTRWAYQLTPIPLGCRLTQRYEIVRPLPRLLERLTARLMPHHLDRRPDMGEGLLRIKAIVEEQERPAA